MLLISSIGNSSAIQCAAQDPLEDLEMADSIISKTPSSEFSKMLANNKKSFVLSSEVFDILNKLLKSDEKNGTGDVQLLCELFSGEKSTYHYSTDENRIIPANTPFCILGSTQLVNAAKLIARMHQGHDLVDRLLIATPLAFCPTLTEMDAAREQLSTEVVDDFLELFRNVNSIDDNAVFEFDNDGKDLLRETLDQFVSELNDAISEGRVPPKSKKPDLIPRIACALHVFNHFMEQLLMGVPSSQPSSTISRTTLQNAASYVSHLETQKDILCQVNTYLNHSSTPCLFTSIYRMVSKQPYIFNLHVTFIRVALTSTANDNIFVPKSGQSSVFQCNNDRYRPLVIFHPFPLKLLGYLLLLIFICY